MAARIPAFTLGTLLAFGEPFGNIAWWTSEELKRPARLTKTPPSLSCHSSTDPGPMPSFLRTSAGTEIWPWAVTLDWGIDMDAHYQGNESLSTNRRLVPSRIAPRTIRCDKSVQQTQANAQKNAARQLRARTDARSRR